MIRHQTVGEAMKKKGIWVINFDFLSHFQFWFEGKKTRVAATYRRRTIISEDVEEKLSIRRHGKNRQVIEAFVVDMVEGIFNKR